MIKPYIVDIRNLDGVQLSKLIGRMKTDSPSGLMINPAHTHMVMFYEGPECSIAELAGFLGTTADRIISAAGWDLRGWQKF